MRIDADVARISAHFGIDPRLIQSVLIAEGNILKAVQCSLPNVKTREQAIEVTCRSAVHAMSDYVKEHAGPDFVAMWANRWAPQGVANDPTNLNKHWPVNVVKNWFA